jgi:hypothetical protein
MEGIGRGWIGSERWAEEDYYLIEDSQGEVSLRRLQQETRD